MDDDKVKEYLAAVDAARRLELAAERAEGRLQELLKRARTEFGCGALDQLERLLADEKRDQTKLQIKLDKMLEGFRVKYGQKLEDF